MTETCQGDEDQSLDNFFAKKDKSKKPKKKKTKKSDEATNSTQSEQSKKGTVDDWKDFAEEKEKDYSSLKIQNLQVMEDNKEDPTEETDDQDGEERDEGGKKKDLTKWNIPASGPSDHAALCDIPNLPGTQNVVGGKYVPPSVKRSNMMGMGQTSSRKPVAAPDIKSKAAFPTLSAANQDLSTPNKSTDFEVVKRGIKTNEARVEDHKPRLDLGNRYDSLRH